MTKLNKMKKILFFVFTLLFLTSNAQDVKKDDTSQKNEVETTESSNATIDFESKVIDYGTIEYNSDGARKFIFTNNGTDPLQIKSARGSWVVLFRHGQKSLLHQVKLLKLGLSMLQIG